MGLKDIVFGLKLDGKQFNDSTKKATAELQKLAGTRMDKLATKMEQLRSSGEGGTKEIAKLAAEYKKLARVAKDTDSTLGKGPLGGKGGSSIFQGIGQGIGQSIYGGVLGALSKASSMITGTFSQAIGAAMESRQAKAGLGRALRNTGQGTAPLEAMAEMADKARKVFKVEDEEVLRGYEALTLGGMKAADAMKNTALMADLAAAKKMSMAEAGQILARVYNGEIRNLKSLGIFITETGDKTKDAAAGMQALWGAFKGAAGEEAALSSPWKALAITVGEIYETLGNKLIPAIMPTIQRAADFLEKFTGTGEFQAILDGIVTRFEGLIRWSLNLMQTIDIKKIGSSLWNIAKEIASMFFDVLVAGGDALAQKIAQAINPLSRTPEQKYLDNAWKQYGGMNSGQISAARSGLVAKSKKSGYLGGVGFGSVGAANEATWQIWALDQMQAGQRTVNSPGIGDVIQSHSSRIQAQVDAMRGQSGGFADFASQGASDRMAAQAQLYGTGPAIGYSARAAAMAAGKGKPNGKAVTGTAAAPSAPRSRYANLSIDQEDEIWEKNGVQRVNVQVTSMDGNIAAASVT